MPTNAKQSHLRKFTDSLKPSDAKHVSLTSSASSQHPTEVMPPKKLRSDAAHK